MLIEKNEMELLKIIFDNLNGNKDLVEFLIKHRININKENRKNAEAPLFNTCRIEYLVEHGLEINIENWNDETPLYFVCF
ncbi:hypothetical protein H8356DRAFT_1343245 [Neocallimastix lanati (nom. inval.)]|nr:hypothetical protein H8356DRAFT_1343245 [Neocallimastix sp. JGI-2020a]